MAETKSGLSTGSFILVVIVIVLIGLGSIGGYVVNSRIVSLRSQNSELQAENTSLNTHISQLSTTISNDNNEISSLQTNVSNLQTLNGNLNSQITSDKNQISSLNSQMSSLQSQNSNLQNQISNLQSQNYDLQNEIANLQLQTDTIYACGNTNGCTLTIWTACGSNGNACPISSSNYYSEGVPDTFDFITQFTSTIPVTVYFLSLDQFVQFYGCGSISCVYGQYQYFPATTSLNGKFTLAEGCGGYIAVFQSSTSGYMYPDISITFNPASSSTGVCA